MEDTQQGQPNPSNSLLNIVIKATLRPLRNRARITPQQRREAQARREALPNKSYLKGVEGCTYKPLKVTTVNNLTRATSDYNTDTLGWRDNYNTSK